MSDKRRSQNNNTVNAIQIHEAKPSLG